MSIRPKVNSTEQQNFELTDYNVVQHVRGAFNKFPDFFVRAFKIVIDSWKFTMLLLYILWDDWLILMISTSNEQLQQQLEYSLLIYTRGAFNKFPDIFYPGI